MQPIAPDLRAKLKQAGLTNQAIDAVWPEWWSDEAESSLSAQAELRFTVPAGWGYHPRHSSKQDPGSSGATTPGSRTWGTFQRRNRPCSRLSGWRWGVS